MSDTESQAFRDLVTGNKSFEIPPYQRNFSWEESHVEELWEDLVEAVDMGREHYIGTFLLKDKSETDEAVREIIDGQQRITTLIIMLFEIQKRINDDDETGGGIGRRIRGEYITNYGEQKLTLAGEDEEFFRDTILEGIVDDDETGVDPHASRNPDPTTPSQQNLLNSKKFIQQKLDEGVPDRIGGTDQQDFYSKLYQKIQQLPLLEYTVDSQSEAARIFQTINDRGKDLTDLEITKSYLMHRIALIAGENNVDTMIQTIQNSFGDMYDAVESVPKSVSEDKIQRYHYIAWNLEWGTGHKERYYREQERLERIKQHFRKVEDPEEVMNYVYELRDMFKIVEKIYNRDELNDRLSEKIKRVLLTDRLGNFYPLLMVAMKQYQDEDISADSFKELLHRIETFIVRTYMIEQKSSDTGRSSVYPLARSLNYNQKEPDPEQVDTFGIQAVIDRMEEYIERYCDNDQLRTTLRNNEVYEQYNDSNRLRELRFLLSTYERTLDREDNPFDIVDIVENNDGHYTIEHVWPQTPSEEFEDPEMVNEHNHRLGNLSLMDKSDQPGFGNKTFEQKKEQFEDSKIRMLEYVFDHDEWSVEAIDQREEQMINSIVEYWSVDC